ATDAEPAKTAEIISIGLLLLASPVLVLFGGDISEFTQQAAQHLHDIQASAYALLPGVAQ
ncbi:hypothetical protein ACTVFP_22470, partial [Escherichia coli]|uniref:hypothetical protein n=1 Tax=Escherichia coli TaxID=562 RepID=UPI003FA59F5E